MSSIDALVLLTALASCWAMTGLIWVIQIVHYPIFDAIDAGDADAGWAAFARRHTASISVVVGPLMLAEGVTGLWIAADPPMGVGRLVAVSSLALMGVAYGVTAFVSAPLHGRLADRFDTGLHERLVKTNWIRTLAWSARAALLFAITCAAIT